MDFTLLTENLTNPALLFFILGVVAVRLKSDLEIPPTSSKFISLYLLFAIGFKGGQELAHKHIDGGLFAAIGFGMLTAILIPVLAFYILRRKFSVTDSGAVAAAYGSVSAVTFVTAVSYLESHGMKLNGHMVAIMALMESPAIIAGLILIGRYHKGGGLNRQGVLKHSLTNGSVMLIMGSLIIGYLASEEQAMGIKPFTTDLFKGFLAIFLLDMGIVSGRKLASLIRSGWFPAAFGILFPITMGVTVALVSQFITTDVTDRFMFAVLAASASYIAVPAAMKIAVPEANPGLYLPMALGVTFPVNITIGLPLYYYMAGI